MTPKIKHETLCNSFDEGCLKNVDINLKIASFQCSWIKQLYDDKFHKWKLIPLHLIKSRFEINFKFHLNLDFDDSKIRTFLSFYNQLFHNWRKYLSSTVNIPSSILTQPIRYNKNLKINSKPIYVEEFVKKYYMIFWTLKMNLKRWMKWRLVIILAINLIWHGDKWSVQFLKLGKKYWKKIKMIG